MSLRISILLGFLLASMAPPVDAKPTLRVGEPFPYLRFPTLADGKLKGIAAYRGQKILLLNFASW